MPPGFVIILFLHSYQTGFGYNYKIIVTSSDIQGLHTTRQKPNLSTMRPPTTAGGQVHKSNMAHGSIWATKTSLDTTSMHQASDERQKFAQT